MCRERERAGSGRLFGESELSFNIELERAAERESRMKFIYMLQALQAGGWVVTRMVWCKVAQDCWRYIVWKLEFGSFGRSGRLVA